MRRARADDTDRAALARLRRQWTEEDAGGAIADDEYHSRAAAWLARHESDRLIWLGAADGHPVGFVTAVPLERMPQPGAPDTAWGYVHHFFVEPGHRSQGIGRLLLDAVIVDVTSLGWERLLLHPRDRSRPFYERAGFRSASDWLVLPIGANRR